MKAKQLKIGVLAIVLIFLAAGASWADNRGSRPDHNPGKKHIRSEYHQKTGYRDSSYVSRQLYAQHRNRDRQYDHRHRFVPGSAKYPLAYHNKYRRTVHHPYHSHGLPCNVFSFGGPAFQSGWSVIIKSKSGW